MVRTDSGARGDVLENPRANVSLRFRLCRSASAARRSGWTLSLYRRTCGQGTLEHPRRLAHRGAREPGAIGEVGDTLEAATAILRNLDTRYGAILMAPV